MRKGSTKTRRTGYYQLISLYSWKTTNIQAAPWSRVWDLPWTPFPIFTFSIGHPFSKLSLWTHFSPQRCFSSEFVDITYMRVTEHTLISKQNVKSEASHDNFYWLNVNYVTWIREDICLEGISLQPKKGDDRQGRIQPVTLEGAILVIFGSRVS